MKKIQFSDGTTGLLHLRYEYAGEEASIIKELWEKQDKYNEILIQLRIASKYAEGVKPSIAWVESQIQGLKGLSSEARNRPTKTICEFKWLAKNGDVLKEVLVFSKISHADAVLHMHCRKIGREAAMRTLIVALSVPGNVVRGSGRMLTVRRTLKANMAEKSPMPKHLRKELAMFLLKPE